MSDRSTFDLIDPGSRAEWRRWLKKNHAVSSGVRVVVHKKINPRPKLTYDEVVEEALCYGWIDSKPNALDEHRYILHLYPRRPRSVWSQRNKERVKRLIKSGLMAPPGLAKVKAAKKDSSWSSLDAVDSVVLPKDLMSALRADGAALRHFAAFTDSSKKIILYWIETAKKPETRVKRIKETVAQAASNIKAYQYRRERT